MFEREGNFRKLIISFYEELGALMYVQVRRTYEDKATST